MPASTALASPRRRVQRRQALIGYAFLAPSLIIFLIFRHGPAVAGLILGFFDWSIVDSPRFISLGNYSALLGDTIFWRALWNTVLYTLLTVPPDIAIALGLAILLNRPLRGLWLFRLAYFTPVVTASAIVAILWGWLYQPNGLINGVLQSLGLPAVAWLADPRWALPSIAAMAVWKHVGYNMLIFLAGLQAIPLEFEEAARIDGASRWAVFRHITLPLLRPVFILVSILTTISSFQVFDSAFVMTNGGPYYATTTLVYYIYSNAFERYQMGYAAAIAFVLFVIILVISLLQNYLFKGGNDVY
jgi:multiple sugar transport system permease protein